MRALDKPPFLLTVTFALGLSCAALGQVQKKPDGPARKAESPAPLLELFLEWVRPRNYVGSDEPLG